MKIVVGLIALLLAPIPGLVAAEPGLGSTTEFGITITSAQVFDAVHETHEFWPPVRRFIASEKFVVADAETRQQTAELIKEVNSRLADRLLGDDEAAALDLMGYLSNRLRLFQIYGRWLATLENDHLAIVVKEHWDEQIHLAHALEADSRQARFDELSHGMKATLQGFGVPEHHTPAGVETWHSITQVSLRLYESPTGKLLTSLEHAARLEAPEAVSLAREVVQAADWATIKKTTRAPIKRGDFERAWMQIEKARSLETARAATGKQS